MHRAAVMWCWGLAVCLVAPATAGAQIVRDAPEVAQGIGVDQRLGAVLPLELTFHDDQNNFVTLGDYFDRGRPVVLSFNYSNCPQLCSVQLRNWSIALRDIELQPGKDFEFVSISIDPLEQAQRAAESKAQYVAFSGRPESAGGWHFLTGERGSIEPLARACGYRYKYVPEQRIYSHPAAFIFCAPDGRIVRYLDGLDGDLAGKVPKALLEASEGKVGSLVDRVLYFAGCYVYDPQEHRYSFAVLSLVRITGVITVVVLLALLLPYWLGRRKPHGTGRRGRPTGSQRGEEFGPPSEGEAQASIESEYLTGPSRP